MQTKYTLLFTSWVGLVLISSALSYLHFEVRSAELKSHVDHQLYSVATLAHHLAPVEFHDPPGQPIPGDTLAPASADDAPPLHDTLTRHYRQLSDELNISHIWGVQLTPAGLQLSAGTLPPGALTAVNAQQPDIATWLQPAEQEMTPLATSPVLPARYLDFDGTDGDARMVWVPVRDNQGRLFAFGASTSLGKLNTQLTRLRYHCIGMTLAIAALLGSLLLLLGKRILSDLGKVSRVARNISQGNYGPSDYFHTRIPELQSLYQSIDAMRVSIKNQQQELTRMLADKRLELATTEQKSRNIIHQSGEAILVLDKDGIINTFNPCAERIFSTRANTAIGKPLASFIEIGVWLHFIHHVEKSGQFLPSFEERVTGITESGEKVPLKIKLSRIETGQHENGFIVFIENISAQIEKEQQLLVARQEAESASHAKSVFLSSVTHELRTPLNAILGFSQCLLEDPDTTLSEDQRNALEEIEHEGHTLLHLINDILDLSRIESGALSLNSDVIDSATLIEQIITDHRQTHRKRPLDMFNESRDPVYIKADNRYLRQAMSHLLDTLAKYSTSKGALHIGTSQPTPNNVCLYIRDTGLGLHEHDRSFIFNPSDQIPAGNGIGLVIVKRMIEAMNGNITFESKAEDDATFWICIPAAAPPALPDTGKAIATTTPAVHAETDSEKTIVYVEDNDANVRLMERILSSMPGIRLLSASTAQAGLALIRRTHPALVLMDVNLPGEMSGLDACAHLRDDPATRAIPIIVISAAIDVQAAHIDKKLYDHYVAKPFSIQQVKATITQLLDPDATRKP